MDALSDPAELAFIQATIAHYGDDAASEVLERLGHAEAGYHAASLSFAEAQAKPKKQRDVAATRAYASRFREVSKRLEETRPPIESLGPRRVEAVRSPVVEMPGAPKVDAGGAGVTEGSGAPSARAVELGPLASSRPPPKVLPSYLQAAGFSVPEVDVTAELRVPPGGLFPSTEPLPFRGASPGEIPSFLADMDTAVADTTPPGSTGTDELPVLDASSPSTPFASAESRVALGPTSRITLIRYAEILAEIGIDPSREARIWARHGVVTVSDQREIESGFRRAFDGNPTLRDELGELVRRHRARLLGQ